MSAEDLLTNIPAGWDCLKLVDCTIDKNISYGIVQPGQHVENGIPIIRINNVNNGKLQLADVLRVSPDIEDKYKRTRLKGGEVLLTLVGSTGQSFVAPQMLKGWNVPRAIAVIRPKIEIGASWINICLQSKPVQHFLDVRANTTVQKTLNLKDVREIPIPIPPEPIKDQIESIAVSLHEKIELNQQINQILEQTAQAIFKSWFVDFEPVKAKIEAKANSQDTERAAMCAISGKSDAELDQLSPNQFSQLCATAGIFPEDLSDSELGLIPIGWKVGNIGDVAIAKGGYAYKSIIFKEVGHPVVKIKNIVGDGTVDLTDCQCIDDGQAQITSGFKLSNGDLLMAMTGATVGKVGLVVLSEKTAYLNQRVAKFESKEFKSRISWFLFCAFRRASIFEQVVGTAQGSAQPNISSKGIESARIVVPTSNCLHEFIDKVEPLFSKWMSNQNEIYKLAAIRDALLPRLLSGEIELESNHTSS